MLPVTFHVRTRYAGRTYQWQKDMGIPVPRPEEVAEFKRLYEEKYGETLTDAEALDGATRLIKYIFLTRHAVPALEKNKRKDG